MQELPGGSNDDIEDRREESGGGGGRGFGGGGFGGIHLGIGGFVVVGLLSLVFHQNFFALLSGGGGGSAPVLRSAPADPAQKAREAPEVEFVRRVVGDVQDTWTRILPADARGRGYRRAKLLLFRESYPSACGEAQSAVGPFYCPGDEKVYLDLGFFQELRQKYGAPGEFAQAYVIAHEIGHHVQKILGTEQGVRRLQQQNPGAANQLSVRMELQADCYAGVWGHSTEERKLIDENDVKAGLQAAAAVGDDRLQRMATGRVSPESFTHGSSAQRMQWFRRGLNSGDPATCNTFGDVSSRR
jgi:predicted metalloprotease